MAEHILTPTRKTLHGILSAHLPPALKIHDGDTVSITTLEADWRTGRPPVPQIDAGTFYPRIPGHDDGHALIGPIEIEGAMPGMSLAVDVLSVIPGDWGWSCIGISDQTHLSGLGYGGDIEFWLWDINVEKKSCKSTIGHEVLLAPFPGVMTVAPEGEGFVTTKIPGSHGGNLDCRLVGTGSRLLLPIFHKGALFSTGDGHAAQGDGESGGTAIECPFKELKLKFTLNNFSLLGPVCQTNDAIITFGYDKELSKATFQALYNMRQHLMNNYNITNIEAMMLCSVCVDLHITQIVNGVQGVHAILENSRLLCEKKEFVKE